MNKSELENGFILETRTGKRYAVFERTLIGMITGKHLNDYTENLRSTVCNEFDIMSVYKSDGTVYNGVEVLLQSKKLIKIWERKEVSPYEKGILQRAYDSGIRWVRKEKGSRYLTFSTEKPRELKRGLYSYGEKFMLHKNFCNKGEFDFVGTEPLSLAVLLEYKQEEEKQEEKEEVEEVVEAPQTAKETEAEKKEKKRQQRRDYYQRNKEHIREYQKNYYSKKKEKGEQNG